MWRLCGVAWLTSDLKVGSWSLGFCPYVASSDKKVCSTLSLSAQIYKWVHCQCGVSLDNKLCSTLPLSIQLPGIKMGTTLNFHCI